VHSKESSRPFRKERAFALLKEKETKKRYWGKGKEEKAARNAGRGEARGHRPIFLETTVWRLQKCTAKKGDRTSKQKGGAESASGSNKKEPHIPSIEQRTSLGRCRSRSNVQAFRHRGRGGALEREVHSSAEMARGEEAHHL